jgi:chromosomal replication initiation ATPase DnaA
MNPSIQILREVAACHGITLSQLRAPGPRMFAVRKEAARRLRDERGLSLNKIGYYLGGRNHSTVHAMLNEEYREKSRRRKFDARYPQATQ